MDENAHKNHFDASMPLPDEAKAGGDASKASDSVNPAAELIRQKVSAAYSDEPNAAEEALDAAEQRQKGKLSRHQQFIYDLTNSGKSLPEIQQSWHEYYAGLPDAQKHEVWQEFYNAHARSSRYPIADRVPAPVTKTVRETEVKPEKASSPSRGVARRLSDLRDQVLGRPTLQADRQPKRPLQSLFFGLGVGSIVVLIFLFSFFNERFIAPFVQPSRNISDTPIISSASAGPNPEVIIPKINVEIPVVYGVSTIDEAQVEKALEGGVVHYADTASPGEDGNIVIVGHSSNNIFNKGKYKFAFVLLSRLDKGDTFYLDKDGKRYTYEIYKKQIVKPTDVSVLATSDKRATATLITCDPPGTSINRLVVVGQQISPDPGGNSPQIASNTLAGKSAIIPGNAPSLWSRFMGWLF